MEVRDQPILTECIEDPTNYRPSPDSCYIFGTLGEERSDHIEKWKGEGVDAKLIRITDQNSESFSAEFPHGIEKIFLRSKLQLDKFYNLIKTQSVYIDITGLSHNVWAPLLRLALLLGKDVKAVYVEPKDYTYSPTPTEGDIFDLSERIIGIRPIPGFATLNEAPEDQICFVPLLGFEGTRLKYIIEEVQPAKSKIIPVVGVPGFRPEYPFHAYLGNRLPLKEYDCWKNIRFATANCPFSLYYLLEELTKEYPNDYIKVAPIGTKPHSLGAILFALSSSRPIEIVYDHPLRKVGRTTGSSRLFIYHLSSFRRSLFVNA